MLGRLEGRAPSMPTNVRIKLTSTDLEKIERVCSEIREIALRTGTKISGPVPLPRRRLVLPVRKSPCGEGSKTWRKHELRIHRRLIGLEITDQRVMREIMRIQIPEDVSIEMQIR
jgi:small subunit ribosomal protein S10